jgi:hypothetical protein
MSMSTQCNPEVTKPFLTSQQPGSFDQTATQHKNEYRKRPSVSFDEKSIAIRKDELSMTKERGKRLSALNSIRTREVSVGLLEPKDKSEHKAPGDENRQYKTSSKRDLKRVLPVSYKQTDRSKDFRMKEIPGRYKFDSTSHVSGSQIDLGPRRECDKGLFIPVNKSQINVRFRLKMFNLFDYIFLIQTFLL